MRLEDEVRSRLRRAAEAVTVPTADAEPVMRRGRRRRRRRLGISTVVALALAAGIGVPLAGLLPTRQSAGVRLIPGASSADVLSLGYFVVLDRPPGWTVLVRASTDRVYGEPVFQLTNFSFSRSPKRSDTLGHRAVSYDSCGAFDPRSLVGSLPHRDTLGTPHAEACSKPYFSCRRRKASLPPST